MTIVRAALVQARWTGDKECMIAHHEEQARQAAAAGRPDHLLPGALLRPVLRPRAGHGVLRLRRVGARADDRAVRGARHELGMVMVLPVYEEEQPGVLYNTAAVIDADGTLPGQVPQAPPAAPARLLGEVLLPARQPRLPGVRDRGRPGRRVHLLRPALPRGLARARPERRADRVQPERDEPRASRTDLWQLEQPAAAVANGYYIGAINRVGIEDTSTATTYFYGTSYVVDPRGQLRRRGRLVERGAS